MSRQLGQYFSKHSRSIEPLLPVLILQIFYSTFQDQIPRLLTQNRQSRLSHDQESASNLTKFETSIISKQDSNQELSHMVKYFKKSDKSKHFKEWPTTINIQSFFRHFQCWWNFFFSQLPQIFLFNVKY